MPDEHDSKLFYAPDNKAVEREAQPGVVLFEFSRASDGAPLRCELRDHGEYGVEVQFFERGELLYGRRLDSHEQAIRWARGERAALEGFSR